MRFTVIIPNYNGATLIKKNLPGVVESLSSYKDSKIIIVDDGSSEEDYLSLKDIVDGYIAEGVPVDLIRKEKNSGFSSTVNKGALNSDSDYIVLLNSDVAPDKDFLIPIIEDFKINENLFGVGCMDRSEEGVGVVLRGRGEAFWKRGFLMHRRGEVDQPNTFWLSGGSSVVRTDLFKKFGGFDEIYDPFYWEDIDLSYRVRKSGYEIMFDNRSRVTHRHLEGAIKKNFSKKKVNKTAFRNQFIFVWKNITDWNLISSHLFWLPYHLAKAVARTDTSFIQGFLLALVMLPDIIKRRIKQKRSYKRKDSEIIYR